VPLRSVSGVALLILNGILNDSRETADFALCGAAVRKESPPRVKKIAGCHEIDPHPRSKIKLSIGPCTQPIWAGC
jgi:hypothetical protein